MPINRDLALRILKYLIDNPSFYFPFYVVCKEYSSEDDYFVELDPINDYETIRDFEEYQTFQLWENLQDLKAETLELMSKGFIEKIIAESLEKRLEELAKEYRANWNTDGWEIEDSEKFGLNEFIGGKAEGFEEALNIAREFLCKKPTTADE